MIFVLLFSLIGILLLAYPEVWRYVQKKYLQKPKGWVSITQDRGFFLAHESLTANFITKEQSLTTLKKLVTKKYRNRRVQFTLNL